MTSRVELDPELLSFKRIAVRGGERGPEFDLGVLDVFRQVESDGRLVRNAVGPLLGAFRDQVVTGAVQLSVDEATEARRILVDRGWDVEQGSGYAQGVYAATCLLSRLEQ